MLLTIQQNVLICPKCSAAMHRRIYHEHIYYICADCKSIWKVIGNGKVDLEVMVTDKAFDIEKG